MVVSNSSVFIGSIISVASSAYYLYQFRRFEPILDTHPQTVPWVATIFGMLILIFSAFGCVAIYMNGFGMVMAYIISISAIGFACGCFGIGVLAELTAGDIYLEEKYFNNLLYKDDNMTFDGYKEHGVHNIQRDFHCCGITDQGYKYYINLIKLVPTTTTTKKPTGFRRKGNENKRIRLRKENPPDSKIKKYGELVFPSSCCKDYENVCLLDEIWGINCVQPLELFGNSSYMTIAITLMCLSLQIFLTAGIGFVFSIALKQFYYY